ncbi:TPA: PD-(D/E)XK nuclease family protein [Candidatus Woesearchaeota archaeon]|nr:PD-(D/E)XK nuclease family protein [Candidatus Woesearchaeota archaeon]HIH05131.1 PD-(D/E)XK nuclease family protein [Candidatus Woesearchaeota archaeon]HII65546.1 PD-(D/E)XK nuclease family protein [Candidatus Woesearchaeota archaeon]
MPYTFSPSSLSLLKDCPRCFWLHFTKGIKRPDSIFPSLPSGMDRVLKEHFDRFMEKGELPPELAECNGECRLFNDKSLLAVWRSNFNGIRWKDERGNLFRGAVDNILVKGKKLVVLDYKTRGYPLKEDTPAHYQDQMDIYNLLLRKNGHETEDYAYLLFYHPNTVHGNGDVDFHSDLVKIPIDASNAERIFRKALEVLEKEIPQPAEECGFCRWARDAGGQS